MLKRPAANATGGMRKKPAMAEPPTNDWANFMMVPFANQERTGEAAEQFGHLKVNAKLDKAPAVVKHIQKGTLGSTTGCQSIKDFLKALEKKGDSSWLSSWNNANHANKKLILERLKLELDDQNLLTVTQHDSAGKRTSTDQVRGWMALWEVAGVEKIPFDPKFHSVLQGLVEGDESRPHSKPNLAAKGWREYYHVKDSAETERMFHEQRTDAKNERDCDGIEDFEDAKRSITAAGGVTKTDTKHTPKQSMDSSKPLMVAWKGKYDTTLSVVSAEANAACQIALDLEQALQKGVNHAVAKKHLALANSWVKKLENKKSQLLKGVSMATHAREDVFKQGNKFDELLEGCKVLLESWAGDDNKVLLEKLLDF